MLPEQYLIASEKLLHEADRLLNSLQLMHILSRYAKEITFVGSYANRTMVWPDIDISIMLKENNVEQFFLIGKELSQAPCIERMLFKNEYRTRPERAGFYWGIQLVYNSNKWKIDIKALNKEDYRSEVLNISYLKKTMSYEQRILAIAAKNKVMELTNCDRVPYGCSYHIYDRIIHRGLTSTDSIVEDMQKEGLI
ncbi:hypothetical protein HFN20_05480 [Paenibacillus dendritiformis]|uniref:hypothetical protein n=1 Tax=Paenibacillus dendritiformis TaxID=130049 RepID=UPI00143D5CE3|nr:hypothetical protein [Paenibacillus dendritiformis]NKI20675.1 hypothetical protein [Paenibacillus dendritiformis]NRF96561.1 hypothetical protein [Paenibacillus dendritiformis]